MSSEAEKNITKVGCKDLSGTASEQNSTSRAEPPKRISADFKRNRHSKSCPLLEIESPTSTAKCEVPTKKNESVEPQSKETHDGGASKKRDSNTTTHLSWNPRRSTALANVSARSSFALEKPAAKAKDQENSTTDLRLSGLRPGLNYLPDLKEESQEGSSVATSRRTSLMLPIRKSSLAHTSVYGKPITKTNSGISYLSKSSDQQLAEARELPSLNFSRIDLVAKLNEALGSKSAPDLGLRAGSLFGAGPYQRPSSVSMREKYKSFFASLDGLERPLPEGVQAAVRFSIENCARHSNEISETRSMDEIRLKKHSVDLPKRGYSIDVLPQFSSLSAEDIMTEITKLSIPSMNGLAHRLSELIPSLAQYYDGDNQVEEAVSHALEDVRGLGRPKIGQVRSNARLRPLPGKSELVVVEDELYAHMRKDDVQCTPSPSQVLRKVRGDILSTPVCELEAPSPAHCRSHSSPSPTEDDEHPFALEAALPPKPAASHRSSPEGRPWNKDKNYPWSSSVPDIDIALPQAAATRSTSRLGPSRLRNHISQSSTASEPGKQGREDSVSPGFTGKILATSPAEDPFDRTSPKQRKSTLFGSLSHKIGFTSSARAGAGASGSSLLAFDTSGYANSPQALGLEDHCRVVDPGDRYPTTGLTPPSAFNIEEARSFFSDDSSNSRVFAVGAGRRRRRRVGGPRFPRRLVNFRRAISSVPDAAALADDESDKIGDGLPGRGADAETGSVRTFGGTGGMSRAEFCARRLADGVRLGAFMVGEAVRGAAGGLCGLGGGAGDRSRAAVKESTKSGSSGASVRMGLGEKRRSRRERERAEMEAWLEAGTDAVEQAEVVAAAAAAAALKDEKAKGKGNGDEKGQEEKKGEEEEKEEEAGEGAKVAPGKEAGKRGVRRVVEVYEGT